ncbi:MAG: hypothetical protein K2Q45_05255 [Nitrosomonas sp.]|nr:hypothetical protein [Nitrosomonas sp.]
MSNIRVRFKLNPGREGIEFSKLAKHADGIENLLRSIAEDIGLSQEQNKWLGKEFKNGSVISTAENQAIVDSIQKARFNDVIRSLIKFKSKGNNNNIFPEGVSLRTLAYFAELKIPLEIDESIGISLYDEGKKASRFYKVKRLKLEEVARAIDTEISYLGSVIGYTYEWTKGAQYPFIKIRDIASNQLIKCSYDDKDYKMVAKLFERKDSLVIVTGRITYNKLTDKTEITQATDFEIAPSLNREQYEGFFGCAQGLTDGVDAAEYIRNIRGDE